MLPGLADQNHRLSTFRKDLQLFLLLTSIAVSSACESPTILQDDSVEVPIDTNTARVEWLEANAMQVSTIDPEWGGGQSDLEPLRSEIGDARIVMLGEASHGDGATFLAKTRLIKFLHREMGFDVLAFESGLYDVTKAWELIGEGADALSSMRGSIFTIWTRSEQVQPLISYVAEAASSSSPLELSGFDCQFSGTVSTNHFVGDLVSFLERHGSSTMSDESWQEGRTLLQDLTDWSKTTLTDQETAALDTLLPLLQQVVDSITVSSVDDEADFWSQLLKSTTIEVRRQWLLGLSNDSSYRQLTAARDQQMGENLIWLANTKYPDRKILVWAASTHMLRNIQDVEWSRYPDFWDEWVTMGQVAWEALGPEIYMVGFTAYDGVSQSWTSTSGIHLDHPRPGGLESLLHVAGYRWAFLDLRSIAPGGEWLSGTLTARPIHHYAMEANWREHMDALFFIHTMTGNRQASQ